MATLAACRFPRRTRGIYFRTSDNDNEGPTSDEVNTPAVQVKVERNHHLIEAGGHPIQAQRLGCDGPDQRHHSDGMIGIQSSPPAGAGYGHREPPDGIWLARMTDASSHRLAPLGRHSGGADRHAYLNPGRKVRARRHLGCLQTGPQPERRCGPARLLDRRYFAQRRHPLLASDCTPTLESPLAAANAPGTGPAPISLPEQDGCKLTALVGCQPPWQSKPPLAIRFPAWEIPVGPAPLRGVRIRVDQRVLSGPNGRPLT